MKFIISFLCSYVFVCTATASPYNLRSNTKSLARSIEGVESVAKAWKTSGYVELKNTYLMDPFYTKLYETFDNFIEELERHPDLRTHLTEVEKKFRESSEGKFICSVPLGAKDRTGCQEKDHKYYFQFTQAYASMLKKIHPKLFAQYPVLTAFFDKLNVVYKSSEYMFDQVLQHLRTQNTDLDSVMRKEGKLAIVLKVLVYYSEDHGGTSPHYDKSGLTLILDNDDRGPESLMLCPYQKRFNAAKLAPVTRVYQKNASQSSALLIPGALLEHTGVQIPPTPHAVKSFQKNVRHALIAFALTPDTDVSTVSSQIIHKRFVSEL